MSDKKSQLPFSRLATILGALIVGTIFAVGLRMAFSPEDHLAQKGLKAQQEQAAALIGGPFELINHKGEKVTETILQGKYSLFYFGYTYCPDVCPTSLTQMSDALDILGDKGKGIQLLFFTVDPERDTQALLADYVSNFHENMIGLTGTLEQTKKAAKAFRVYYAKVSDPELEEKGIKDEDYLMDHTSIVYFFGPDGKYVRHFTHQTSPEEMAKAIADVL